MRNKQPKDKENNAFFNLLNFIADPVLIVDDKGYLLLVNNATEALAGLSSKDLIGKSLSELKRLDEKSKVLLFENQKRRLAGVFVEPYEITFKGENGESRYAEVTAKKVSYNGKTAFLGLLRDITRRKQNETRLKEYSEKMELLVDEKVREIKESNKKLKGIFDSSPYSITEVDLKGKILECNKMALEQQGLSSKDELVGKNCFELVSPKDRQKAKRNFRQALKTGGLKRVELTITNKKGDTFVVSLSAKLMKDASGKPKSFVTITKNITERKQMELKLREAEKRYHALFGKAPLGILLIDKTGTAIEFNKQAHSQLGYSREEFAKLAVSDYATFETPEETRARMKKVLRDGKDEFETKHRTKNGEIKDVINTVQVIELAGKKFFHMITQDITEKKKIENELKMERDKLEAVTENIGAGLVIISKDYRILWVNNYLRQVNPSCEGKACYSTFNKLNAVCPDCGVRKVFENGVSLDRHEYAFTGIQGNPMWAELIATPLKDKDGNIIAALELSVDITEKKLLQKKLKEYSAKLEQLIAERTEQLEQTQAKLVTSERLAAIGELAAMVGHDLRNPLTGIMGAAYYLKTKHSVELGAKGTEMLETMENSINYANKIVNDLLEYSRDLKLELTETTPKKLLKTTLSLIEVPDKIKIVDATENKPTVKVDAEKMRRVLVNIIKNAFDAMPEGGTLTVESREVKGKLEITFKDTGIGMSEETLSKLEGDVPLFTTKAKGMGFGLPICRRIAEAHSGRIYVKSKIGKGTTVTLTVPVKHKPLDAVEELLIFNGLMLEDVTAGQKRNNRKTNF